MTTPNLPLAYGGITLRTSQPIVLEAPDRTLMTANMFATGGLAYINGELICVGVTEAGQQVWYKITGWDAQERGLILERHYRNGQAAHV